MAMGDATPERWLPARGLEGSYEVSDQGRVRSVDRVVIYSDGRQYSYRGKVLRPAVTDKGGHLSVAPSVNGKPKTMAVHQLVMEAFAGPRPRGLIVCHGPGGVQDNRLANLSYGSHVKNSGEDRLRDGTLIHGDSHQGARLTEATVLECRRRYAAGETQTALAAEYGVSGACMSLAMRGITWAGLPGAAPAHTRHRGRSARLAPEIAEEARRRYAAGESRVALAAEYGVTRATLWMTIRR